METIMFNHPALIDNETGEQREIKTKAHYEVCPWCGGGGTCTRTDIDDSLLVDSMMEDGDDEGIESYHRGSFDQVCPTCNGLRVILVPTLPEWASKLISIYYSEEAEDRKYAAQERAFGA
jgi:DnaJ-class molecular chaperone